MINEATDAEIADELDQEVLEWNLDLISGDTLNQMSNSSPKLNSESSSLGEAPKSQVLTSQLEALRRTILTSRHKIAKLEEEIKKLKELESKFMDAIQLKKDENGSPVFPTTSQDSPKGLLEARSTISRNLEIITKTSTSSPPKSRRRKTTDMHSDGKNDQSPESDKSDDFAEPPPLKRATNDYSPTSAHRTPRNSEGHKDSDLNGEISELVNQMLDVTHIVVKTMEATKLIIPTVKRAMSCPETKSSMVSIRPYPTILDEQPEMEIKTPESADVYVIVAVDKMDELRLLTPSLLRSKIGSKGYIGTGRRRLIKHKHTNDSVISEIWREKKIAAFLRIQVENGKVGYYCEALLQQDLLNRGLFSQSWNKGFKERSKPTSLLKYSDRAILATLWRLLTSRTNPHDVFFLPNTTTIYDGAYERITLTECIKRINGQVPYICRHCLLEFPSHLERDAHYGVHKDSFKCGKCELEFSTNAKRRIHCRKEHQKSFKCEKCGEIFDSDQKRKVHYRSIHQKSFKCGKCEVEFDSESKRKAHYRSIHQTSFKCKKCGEIFDSDQKRKVHRSTECCDSFKCGKCEIEFDTIAKRNAHYIKEHRDSFQCGKCGVEFDTIAKRSMHYEVHKTSFKCRQCGEIFDSKSERDRHTKIHK